MTLKSVLTALNTGSLYKKWGTTTRGASISSCFYHFAFPLPAVLVAFGFPFSALPFAPPSASAWLASQSQQTEPALSGVAFLRPFSCVLFDRPAACVAPVAEGAGWGTGTCLAAPEVLRWTL